MNVNNQNNFMTKDDLLKRIMELDFSIIDLNLYLDTHPNDMRAVMMYNQYTQQAIHFRNQYQRLYGPLTVGTFISKCPWQWIESPWPWEKGVQ